MGIRTAYFEMVEAQIESFKAKVAVAKADAKISKAKKETLDRYDQVKSAVLERLETPKAMIKSAFETGDEAAEVAKASVRTIQNEIKEVATTSFAKIKQLIPQG